MWFLLKFDIPFFSLNNPIRFDNFLFSFYVQKIRYKQRKTAKWQMVEEIMHLLEIVDLCQSLSVWYVLDSSHIGAVGVKWPDLVIIF